MLINIIVKGAGAIAAIENITQKWVLPVKIWRIRRLKLSKYHDNFIFCQNHYLGLNKEKRKLKKPSEKFKNIFNFEWDKEEDTSADIIYKNANEPHLLFGRGIRGGFDIKEQKKKTK